MVMPAAINETPEVRHRLEFTFCQQQHVSRLQKLISFVELAMWLGPGENDNWRLGQNWSERAAQMMGILTEATNLIVVNGKYCFEGMTRKSATDLQHFSGDPDNQTWRHSRMIRMIILVAAGSSYRVG